MSTDVYSMDPAALDEITKRLTITSTMGTYFSKGM